MTGTKNPARDRVLSFPGSGRTIAELYGDRSRAVSTGRFRTDIVRSEGPLLPKAVSQGITQTKSSITTSPPVVLVTTTDPINV